MRTDSADKRTANFSHHADRLCQTEYFAFGGTGRAMSISAGERDFEAILSLPSALSDFEKIFAAGNPQAKAYALEGIRRLMPERFQQLAHSLRNSKQEIETIHGCEILRVRFGEVVAQIESGKFSSS